MITHYRCAACDHEFEVPEAHREKRYLCPDCGAELGVAAPAPASPAPKPQVQLGPYRLLEQIGRGGTGVVFRAEDTRNGRTVALKCLQGLTADEVARFTREARMASSLSHENIARVVDVGEADGTPYIVLEFLEGRTIDAADLPIRDAIAAMATIARAMHHAHENRVLHRDVKPRNLLIDGAGKPWILDFGLSKRVATETATPTLSMTGLILGTPAYMSPEQARGEVHALDSRTDVYGLGATLYQVLSGAAPFGGESPLKVILKVLSEEPVRVEKLNRNVPAALARIVKRAMAKSRDARYVSALAFAEDLERFLRGEPVEPNAEAEELAELTETLGRITEALASFPADATLYATRARVHAERAGLLRRQGGAWRTDLDRAIDDATRALERGGDAVAFLLRGQFRLARGKDPEAAIADLSRARELLGPGDPRPKRALARAFAAVARRRAKRGLEAASWYEAARGESSGRLRAWVDLQYARHLVTAGQDARALVEEAVGALDEVVRANARDSIALRLRADARRMAAEKERAAGREWRPLAALSLRDYDAVLRLVVRDSRATAGLEAVKAL